MIIHQIDIKCIPLFKPEDDSPIARDRDTPHTSLFALQRMQPVTGQFDIEWMERPMQVTKHVTNPPDLIRADSAPVCQLKQTLEPTMPESLYQIETYRVSVQVSTISFAADEILQRLAGSHDTPRAALDQHFGRLGPWVMIGSLEKTRGSDRRKRQEISTLANGPDDISRHLAALGRLAKRHVDRLTIRPRAGVCCNAEP